MHETTHVPAGPTRAERSFNVDYSCDGNYGRMKAMIYPSGELVAFNYDARGNHLGESQTVHGGLRGPVPYRNVTGMSPRGQITGQAFANGVSETSVYDDSTGLVTEIKATGLSKEAITSGCQSARNFLLSPETQVGVLKGGRTAYWHEASQTVLIHNPSSKNLGIFFRSSNGATYCLGLK